MNLRAKPIYGYVTDSAGNVVRSATVTVKEFTSSALYRVVDNVKTESTGAFVTKSLKPGVYDLFETGVFLMRVYHTFGNGLIPGFKASSKSGAPSPSLSTYGLGQDDLPLPTDINNYIYCVQIEGDDIDVVNNGHSFPVYAGSVDMSGVFSKYSMSSSSTISSSKFNVEYYYPNVKTETYRSVNWRNVRAVSYSKNKPLVLPLTYNDMFIDPLLYTDYEDSVTISADSSRHCSFLVSRQSILHAIDYNVIGKGDIVSVKVGSTTKYGIILNDLVNDNSGSVLIWLQLWNKIHGDGVGFDAGSGSLKFYSGFSTTIEGSASSMPDRVTIFEDMTSEAMI